MCSQSLMSPNFLLITSLFISTTTSTHPWSFEKDWRNLRHGEAGTTCPENTVQLDKTVCGCSHLPRAPQETRFRSWTRLCLSLQRVKLIPRVFIPTAELLQTWLTQQSRFKINDERVSKYSFYTDDLLFLSTTGKTHTVWLSKLAKSVSITESDGVSLGIKF